MRTKVTLALIFLNVAVFFFIFYLKENGPKSPVDYSILGPEVANIQAIEISGPGRPAPIRVEKHGENWSITQPEVWPANEFAVNTIVNELEQLHSDTSFAVKDLEKNGQSLADYGLDKPPLTVTLTAGGSDGIPAKTVVLQIGDTAKVGNRLYILSPDRERIHVVHRSLAESLLIPLDALRSNIVFSVPVYEVRSLNLQAGAPTGSKVRIARSETGWMFETPVTARANKTETDEAVNHLNALRIQSFTEPRAAESLHLTPEEMTLRITLEGNNRREALIVGGRVPDQPAPTPAASTGTVLKAPETSPETGELYYAKMEDKTATFTVSIPAHLLETLRNAQEKLRDPHILDIDPANVSSVSLAAAGQPELTLQRLEANSKIPLSSAWQLVQRTDDHSQTVAADREIVDQLIQHLCQLSAERFESDAPIDSKLEFYGFRRPARRIRLALTPPAGAPASSPNSLVLEIGIGEDRHVYAKLDSPNYVYRVSEDILQQTPFDPLTYRDRLLRDLPAGAKITALKLTDLSTDKVVLDVTLPLPDTDSAAAKTTTPPLTPAIRAALDSLVKQLRTLRAKKFVRDRFTKTILVSGEERPWKYQLTTTLSLVSGNGNQTAISILFFSDREGGATQFVGAPDADFNVVFEAEQPLIDALFAITYGPHDPGPTIPKSGSEN